MVAYPEIQTKVQKEIDSVVGKFMFILFVPLSGIGLQFLVVSFSPVPLCLGCVPRPWPFLVKHCIYVYFSSYIRHLSYCFYIAVNRISVAIYRIDGALKPWSAIHLGVGNSKQKPASLDLPVPVM